MGRGFASLGIGPLYIGDITLVCGLVVALRSGCITASFASLPNCLIAILMAWVVVRTVPYLAIYGLNAPRDSVTIMYGLFGFIVVSLMLEAPHRLATIIRAYSRFANFYAPIGLLIAVCDVVASRLPVWPGSGIPIVALRQGELASHLAGIAVFALLGMRRVSWWWTLALLAGIASLTPSRGGTMACLGSIALAVVLGRRLSRLIPVLVIGGVVFIVFYMSGVTVVTHEGRSIGAAQIVEDVESVLGNSDAGNLDDTKEWRLHWWYAIENYTFDGPYFWTGKGFGVNLAEADGFMVGQELGGPPLRSPHSCHLTILARCGVPGLILWGLVLCTWFATMVGSMVKARRRGDVQFANLFVWVACYLAAIVIDASFDVALEGPMLGIWFWCLFGLGTGSAMIYRAALRTLPLGSKAPILMGLDYHVEGHEPGRG
jgi:hypothetical protein